jgi:hypothetical protein
MDGSLDGELSGLLIPVEMLQFDLLSPVLLWFCRSEFSFVDVHLRSG